MLLGGPEGWVAQGAISRYNITRSEEIFTAYTVISRLNMLLVDSMAMREVTNACR